ncbi:pentatricopeptide repeat-containing protein At3g12770-like [Magnolia sinica]|uniref:pentatricopeptide repeat-containing protein At3g12770-like n=1 Tax=Magnolia sinica TaxID=86752 RepID=UPI00265A4117|nr:pentatricopeptide repeat-containing protein At3g12770-like [Magnolia sinica]
MLLTTTKTHFPFYLIRPKTSKISDLLHTTSEIQYPCNSYTHLFKSHPQTRSIEQIHARIIVEGTCHCSFSATHLVKSYAKAGYHLTARRIFESVPNKSVFLWNAMIRACNQIGSWLEVAELYRRMEGEEIEPDGFTLPFVIKAFSALSSVEDGKRIYELANRIGLVRNVHVATALIGMLLNFNEIGLAREIFDRMPERDIVAWTAMITGYIHLGYHCEALQIFREMRLGDEKPNSITVLSLISACGYTIHALIIKLGLGFSVEVETAILDMYAKSGDLAMALSLFDSMSQKSLVSWTAMVDGYAENKFPHEAISLFRQMLKFPDLKPDTVVTMSVIQACAQLGSLNCGEMIHGYVLQHGFESELPVETALVDMYAKCGNINAAQMVFNRIQDPSMVTWSAMISGYGFHGLGCRSLDLFEQMKTVGFMPDEAAFLSVLSACSHSGLVYEGRECFESMVQMHGMTPNVKHYACMVDLLGRAGLIVEACGLIEGMSVEPDANVWGALLSACRVKGNVGAAELACRSLCELGADNADYNVLIANVYAGFGRWDEVSKVRSGMRRKGEGKTPGCSFVEVNCKMHAFVAGDRSHPQSKDIYAMLENVHALAGDER